jgi:hypothetical protein
MGAKALLIHPSYQGVCGRNGTEDLCVTPGGLVGFLSGVRISESISEERSKVTKIVKTASIKRKDLAQNGKRHILSYCRDAIS